MPLADIDLVLLDRAYQLGAGEGGGGACGAPQDGVLVLQSLRPADELVDLDELRPDEAGRKPTAKERTMAAQLIDALHEPFDASTS